MRVIRGYRAIIDPAAVNLGFEMVVLVTMQREDSDTVAEFERLVAQIPNVVQAQRLVGTRTSSSVSSAPTSPTTRSSKIKRLASYPASDNSTPPW